MRMFLTSCITGLGSVSLLAGKEAVERVVYIADASAWPQSAAQSLLSLHFVKQSALVNVSDKAEAKRGKAKLRSYFLKRLS